LGKTTDVEGAFGDSAASSDLATVADFAVTNEVNDVCWGTKPGQCNVNGKSWDNVIGRRAVQRGGVAWTVSGTAVLEDRIEDV
jgi:hypothetical protein